MKKKTNTKELKTKILKVIEKKDLGIGEFQKLIGLEVHTYRRIMKVWRIKPETKRELEGKLDELLNETL